MEYLSVKYFGMEFVGVEHLKVQCSCIDYFLGVEYYGVESYPGMKYLGIEIFRCGRRERPGYVLGTESLHVEHHSLGSVGRKNIPV